MVSPEAMAAAPKARPEVPTARPSSTPSRAARAGEPACGRARAGRWPGISVIGGTLRRAPARGLGRYFRPAPPAPPEAPGRAPATPPERPGERPWFAEPPGARPAA